MAQVFNTSKFRNKRTIYVSRRSDPGISDIFDWNEIARRYVRREFGHRYYAIKRVLVGATKKQVSKCFDGLEEARGWRRSRENRPVEAREVALNQIIELYFEHREGQIRSTTQRTYRNQAASFTQTLGLLCPSQIDEVAIDRWLADQKRKSGLMNSSRLSFQKEIGFLGQVLRYYKDYHKSSYEVAIRRRHLRDSILSVDEWRARRSRTKRHFLSETERERFLGALQSEAIQRGEDGFVCLALVQVFTGMRIGEVCALTWSDVEWSEKSLRVSRTVHWSRESGVATSVSPTTKSGESRRVPLPEVVLAQLKQLQRTSSRSLGLIFSKDGQKPLSYRAVQYRYNKAFKGAAIDFSSTHILRHTFATDFLSKTDSRSALQGILGHATSKQTEHYAKITDELKAKAMSAYSELIDAKQPMNVLPMGIAGKSEVRQNVASVSLQNERGSIGRKE